MPKPILERFAPNGEAAAVAVIAAPGTHPDVVWQPGSLEQEPAFLVYSITKTFTAALILQLADEGRLGLDDPLARWFPAIVESNRITLRLLLNHRSGLRDYGPLPAYHAAVRNSPSVPWTFERFAAETIDKGPLFPPGDRFAYSNPGYMLLTRVAEQTGDASYAELVSARIARPLGLGRTFVAESMADLSSLAPALSRLVSSDEVPRDVRRHYHPGWVSHGVIASTASDVARFFDALAAGRVISQRALADMLTLVRVDDDPPGDDPLGPVQPSYGLGVMGDPKGRLGLTWGHNGGGPGYSASCFHAPGLGGATACAIIAAEVDAGRTVSEILREFAAGR